MLQKNNCTIIKRLEISITFNSLHKLLNLLKPISKH